MKQHNRLKRLIDGVEMAFIPVSEQEPKDYMRCIILTDGKTPEGLPITVKGRWNAKIGEFKFDAPTNLNAIGWLYVPIEEQTFEFITVKDKDGNNHRLVNNAVRLPKSKPDATKKPVYKVVTLDGEVVYTNFFEKSRTYYNIVSGLPVDDVHGWWTVGKVCHGCHGKTTVYNKTIQHNIACQVCDGVGYIAETKLAKADDTASNN